MCGTCGQAWRLQHWVQERVDEKLGELALLQKPVIGFHVRYGDKVVEDTALVSGPLLLQPACPTRGALTVGVPVSHTRLYSSKLLSLRMSACERAKGSAEQLAEATAGLLLFPCRQSCCKCFRASRTPCPCHMPRSTAASQSCLTKDR